MISLSKLSTADLPVLSLVINTHMINFCICTVYIDNRPYIILRDEHISGKELFLNRIKHSEELLELTDSQVCDIVSDTLGQEEIRRTIYNELGVS